MLRKIENSGDAEDARKQMAKMFGPSHVDQNIRQAISTCWMSLPKEKQNPAEVEKMFRHLVERALRDFKEDSASFAE